MCALLREDREVDADETGVREDHDLERVELDERFAGTVVPVHAHRGECAADDAPADDGEAADEEVVLVGSPWRALR